MAYSEGGGPSHAQLPHPNPTETPYTLTLEYSQFLKHHLPSYFQLATLFPLAKLLLMFDN